MRARTMHNGAGLRKCVVCRDMLVAAPTVEAAYTVAVYTVKAAFTTQSDNLSYTKQSDALAYTRQSDSLY